MSGAGAAPAQEPEGSRIGLRLPHV